MMANDEPMLSRLVKLARGAYEGAALTGGEPTDDYSLLQEINERKGLLEDEQARQRALHARWDNLYFPQVITTGGPDHWPEDKNARTGGRIHISDNAYPSYVNIPAQLMATPPIVNYLATGITQDERAAAERRETLFREWWDRNDMDTKLEETGIVRGLYGMGYWKALWNAVEKVPELVVIDQPANLYVGWGASDYSRMDWAIYCYGLSPQAVAEEFGLDVTLMKDGDSYVPVTSGGDIADPLGTIARDLTPQAAHRSAYEKAQIEVYDYWYKKARGKGKAPEIWNCVYVGNTKIKDEKHAELRELPFIAIPNGKVPGQPWGRSELYDVEQLLREKDERLSEAAEMLHSAIAGQKWQLVGDEAPEDVPENAIPKAGKVSAPGPGNRLEPIQPVVLQFQAEEYLKRIDRDLAANSGLNDLLLGLAPQGVLNSSKAISALTANYVGRIGLKRKQLYTALQKVWETSARIWENKNKDVRALIDGNYRIEIKAPDVTPRDEFEVMQMAINALQNNIWALDRAMDRTGVDDVEDEKTLIRESNTDASLFPAKVQAQVTLLSLLQQLQQPVPTQDQLENTNRQLTRPAKGSQSANAPENQGQPPPEAQAANAPGNPESRVLAQTLVQGGEAQGRVIGQTPIEAA